MILTYDPSSEHDPSEHLMFELLLGFEYNLYNCKFVFTFGLYSHCLKINSNCIYQRYVLYFRIEKSCSGK